VRVCVFEALLSFFLRLQSPFIVPPFRSYSSAVVPQWKQAYTHVKPQKQNAKEQEQKVDSIADVAASRLSLSLYIGALLLSSHAHLLSVCARTLVSNPPSPPHTHTPTYIHTYISTKFEAVRSSLLSFVFLVITSSLNAFNVAFLFKNTFLQPGTHVTGGDKDTPH
jgi:hypothetical protein